MKFLSSLVTGVIGLGTIAGSVGAYLHFKDTDVYVLVKNQTPTTAATDTSKTKNYYCEWQSAIDNECVLLKINLEANKKSIEVSKLLEAKTKPSPSNDYATLSTTSGSETPSNTFFLLKTKTNFLYKYSSSEMEVVSSSDTSKKTKFTILGNFNEKDDFIKKQNFVVGKLEKVESKTTTEGTKKYKCYFEGQENNSKDCQVCEISNPAASTDVNSFSFSDITFSVTPISALTQPADTNKYYLIELDPTQKVAQSDLNTKKIVYVEESTPASEGSLTPTVNKLATFAIAKLVPDSTVILK